MARLRGGWALLHCCRPPQPPMKAPPASEPPTFPAVGTLVELRGLKARSDLNGRQGEVNGEPHAGRVSVLLRSQEGVLREARKPPHCHVWCSTPPP